MPPNRRRFEKPGFEIVGESRRDHLIQQQVRVEVSPGQMVSGYLLMPEGAGPFPAVLVPFYEPETSAGLRDSPFLDFGLQLARRGFVTLSIGSPSGDARKPLAGVAPCQPLSFLAYVAANCWTALHERFAVGVWSDPGIVFDEERSNVNYWEPWYLGLDPNRERRPGVPTPENPRTGAYQQLVENGHDLHEIQALMAPRPFLVSGGAEDPVERWHALNRIIEVNTLLGFRHRVAMTTRPGHNPTPEASEQIYLFLEHLLQPR